MEYYFFAAGYGCGDYGQTQAYNSCESVASQDSKANSSGGELLYTGDAAVFGILGGIMLIVVGMTIFLRSYKKTTKQKNTKEK